MSIDMTANPVAIVAFVLTCLGCVQAVCAISALDWWVRHYPEDGVTVYNGVWTRKVCTSGGCTIRPGTELVGGQEAEFIGKVFSSLTALLSIIAVVGHLLYFCLRKATIRTITVFCLGAACVFGLIGTIVFFAYYNGLNGDVNLGPGFYVLLVGAIFCGIATGVTVWAAVRRIGSDFGMFD